MWLHSTFFIITGIRKNGKEASLFYEGLMNQTPTLKNLYSKVDMMNQTPTLKNLYSKVDMMNQTPTQIESSFFINKNKK